MNPSTERESQIHMARVYLTEARRTKHRNWAFTLLGWAANCRRRATVKPAGQMDMFA